MKFKQFMQVIVKIVIKAKHFTFCSNSISASDYFSQKAEVKILVPPWKFFVFL